MDPTTSDATTTTTTTQTEVQRQAAAVSTSPVQKPILAAGRYKIIVARDDGEPAPYVAYATSKVFHILAPGQSCHDDEAEQRKGRSLLRPARHSS
jgi:hypothetical protein